MTLNPIELNAFTTRAPDAQEATCSPPEVFMPMDKADRSGRSGLVASMRTLPDKSPAPFTVCSVAGHGVESTSTSLARTVSATVPAEAPGPAPATSVRVFSDCGSRELNTTRCPSSLQRIPRVPPTFPDPMIPMFMCVSPRLRLQQAEVAACGGSCTPAASPGLTRVVGVLYWPGPHEVLAGSSTPGA